jgi:hypothetical protein
MARGAPPAVAATTARPVKSNADKTAASFLTEWGPHPTIERDRFGSSCSNSLT